MITRKSKFVFILFGVAVLAVGIGIGVFHVFAAPSGAPGAGTGAISVGPTGNVGVGGTSTPMSPLSVVGNIYATGNISCGGTCGGGASQWTTNGSYIYYNGGNVGIGTSTPQVPLHVVNSVTNNSPLLLQAAPTYDSFSVLPWTGVTYLDFGIYYKNGGWVQAGYNSNNSLIAVAPVSGVTWYDSNTGNSSWNVASAAPLWDQTGAWTGVLHAATNATIGGGSGKLTVGTVDPAYTINGAKYATYLSGMTGQKEETTGVADLDCPASGGPCEYVIDFGQTEKGSDLWLFANVTNSKNNLDQLSVLLTPSFDGRVWYEKDASNDRLTIFASPSSPGAARSGYQVSYRLTAPRFDSASWHNTRTDEPAGLIINN